MAFDYVRDYHLLSADLWGRRDLPHAVRHMDSFVIVIVHFCTATISPLIASLASDPSFSRFGKQVLAILLASVYCSDAVQMLCEVLDHPTAQPHTLPYLSFQVEGFYAFAQYGLPVADDRCQYRDENIREERSPRHTANELSRLRLKAHFSFHLWTKSNALTQQKVKVQ
ncbi:hypothetical protein EVAR_51278_1 [Eumeta japonica]|uniref:Uncharacterized protein n=1 Tax=Eumeta variegata TaxID=151549 RepID=A0A4C1YBL7_EUMVA|nr:hypothetical protein EVAR_51278_1 [Eumeta japonica]